MYVVGTSFTYPKLSKDAKKFCNVWSLLFVTFKTMPLEHVSREKCMLKCYVGVSSLSFLTTKVPYVSV